MEAGLAPPWYCYPGPADGDSWERLRDAGLGFAVANVADGPGAVVDENYAHALRPGSTTPFLGYVPIGYGRRRPLEVRADAAAWAALYGLTGIFLDEVPATRRHRRWDLSVIDQLRADGFDTVVVNPGVAPVGGEIIGTADVTCVFEGSWVDYTARRHPDWLGAFPAARQWHLVHSVPASEPLDIADRARRWGAGYSWATRGRPPHPWGQGWEGRLR